MIARRSSSAADRLRRSLARSMEHVLWGGELRERLLIALLRRHYESVFRRQWKYAVELPHYF